ncbi:MAG: hypothetical protein Q8T13_23850 [Acidobacteriota bacterium]|nr:hypothetical protein [Acidobacteriota bacterium]
MARGRIISKSLSTSQRYLALHDVAGKLAEFCQALFPLLVAHSDDFGRMPGDPQTVKFLVFPGSPRKFPEFQAALQHLEQVGLITVYPDPSSGGERICLQVNNFEAHQSGLHKRTKSRFPEAPANSGKVREFPGNSGSRELNGIEEKRKEEEPEIVPVTNDPTDTWQRVIGFLEISEHTKGVWLQPCWLLRETDELIEIAAPNTLVATHLRTNLSLTLKEAMAVACPGKGLSIVVQKPAAKRKVS